MLRLSLLVTVLSVTTAVTAWAGTPRERATAAQVPTLGVNFSDPVEVRAFHTRLSHAAKALCDSGITRRLAVTASDQACARDALDRSVAELGKPMLTAFHQGQPVTAADRVLARR